MKKNITYLYIAISLLFSACTPNGLNKDALVLDVKSLSFDKETLLFGNEQDIMINGIHDSILSVTRINDGFVWKLNKPVYIALNGINPNAISFDTIQSVNFYGQNVKQQIVSALRNRFSETDRWFTGSDNWQYTRLADILNIDSLQTLIAYRKSEKKIILLDRSININGNRQFKSSDIIHSKSLKIELFRTFHSEFLSNKKHEKYFHKGDTCFTTSVKSFYTPFGANEITLNNTGNATQVSFNKIYRALIPKTTIDTAYSKNEKIPVSLRQIQYANTYSNEVYSTNIANPNYWEFGTIDGNYKFTVEEKSCLKKGEYKAYRLNKWDFLKGLIPLLLIFFLRLHVVFLTNYEYISESSIGDKNRWQMYCFILYALLFLFSVGRIFIGFNLSYTQPFSVFAFPTAVIVSPLILLCVLLLWLVFLCMEYDFKNILKLDNWKKRLWLIPVNLIVITAIFVSANLLLPDIFKFYWQDFTWQHCNPFGNDKLVFCQTIVFLALISAILTSGLIVNNNSNKLNRLAKYGINRTKLLVLIFIAAIAISFFLQQSSISVSLLLLCVILYWLSSLTKWLEIDLNQELNEKNSLKIRIGKLCLLLCPLIVIGVIASIKHDSGYFINLLLFPIFITVVLFYQYHKYGHINSQEIGKSERRKNLWVSTAIITGIILLVASGMIVASRNYDPFSSDRLVERSVAYFDFSTIQQWGYRLSEERAQFFAEMAKYSFPSEFEPYEPAHSGISGFIDPVVENDLSVPFGMIYQFGKAWRLPIILLIIMWCCLCFLVLQMSVMPKNENSSVNNSAQSPIYFSTYGIIRIFCMSLIVSSGLWLILSYFGIVPFTGRLIYGLGQDSIGEVFETVFLFAFMGLFGKAHDNSLAKK